jgi:subtilisin family serine protease
MKKGNVWMAIALISFVVAGMQPGVTPAQDQNGRVNEAPLAGVQAVNRPQGPADVEVVNGVEAAAGEVLLAFHPGAAAAQADAVRRGLGAEEIKVFPRIGGHHWRLPPGLGVAQAVQALSRNPNVRYAEPNYILYADLEPNDPGFPGLWGLHNTGQTGGTLDADIDAPEAWDIATGTGEVVAGVIDTGVDYNHEDLAANMWTNDAELYGTVGVDDDGNGYIDDVYGWDFYNDDNDPFDDDGHGTHCSGTIGAMANNSTGVVGVNWNVQIMALKFLNEGGGGLTDDAVEAVLYATWMRNHGVNIVLTSNSWGGGGFSQALKDAIQASGDAGMLFIAAAGNGRTDTDANPHYPSSYDLDNIISVAATDHNDDRAPASNWGATSVDLGAPGVSILSTTPGNTYSVYSGTSMATPHVAGVAALAWSIAGSVDYGMIRDAIFVGVDPVAALDPLGPTPTFTGGRLNAHETLQQVGMVVSGSTPSAGEFVATLPTIFVIDFSFPVDGVWPDGTLESTDLTVNDIPAYSVTLSPGGLTAAFTFDPSPVTVEGLQIMHMDAASVATSSAVPPDPLLKEWTATFRWDITRMGVISTDPSRTDPPTTVTLPFPPLQVTFNEPYDPASADAADLILSQGSVVDVDTTGPPSAVVVYTLAGIVNEGTLTVNMPAGALTDVYGNPMLPYSGSFELDFGVVPFATPLEAKAPLGSLIYDPTVSAFISDGGDTDSFTIDIDAYQTITVVADPDENLQPTVSLSGPLSAGASAGAPGEDAVIQTAGPTSAGTYTVTVGGVGTSTGAYTLQLILNSAVEDESHDGAGNSTLGTAQNIEGSFVGLSDIGGQRGAVRGQITWEFTTPVTIEDFEHGNLDKYREKGTSNTSVTDAAAHDGEWGLQDETNSGLKGWIFRNDGAVRVQRGDVISVWVRSEGTPTGRAYFGFGASPKGTLSIVMAPSTGQLLIQRNADYDYEDIGAASQSWEGDHWYRMELVWETDGDILGSLYDSDGTTLLNTVSANDTMFSSGGIAFRAFGSTKYFDTVEVSWLSNTDPDFYAFSLNAGESATLALRTAGGNAHLELLDSSGAPVASGSATASNVDEVIADFVSPHSEDPATYFARVTGDTSVKYTLVLTRGATFDLEDNSGPEPWNGDPAQTINPNADGSTVVLGHVRGGSAADASVLYYVDSLHGDDPFLAAMSNLSITPTIAESFEDFAALLQAGGWDLAILLDQNKSYIDPPWLASMLDWVTDGGRAILADWTMNETAAAAFGATYTGNTNGDSITHTQIDHPIWQGIANPFDLTNPGWGTFSMGLMATTGDSIGIFLNGDHALILGNGGRTVLNGFLSDTAATFNEGIVLAQNEIAFLLEPEVDFYEISVAAVSSISLTTLTPAAGNGEFVNELDPAICLYNSAGALVAWDDNSADGPNAELSLLLGAGVYYIEVLASDDSYADPTSGEYVLTIEGVTPGPPPTEPTKVRVSSITYGTAGGKNQDRHLQVTISLLDDLGGPVAGASVSAALYLNGALDTSWTGTTGADGAATFQRKNAPSGTYTTEIIAVSAAGLSWDGVTPEENGFTKP